MEPSKYAAGLSGNAMIENANVHHIIILPWASIAMSQVHVFARKDVESLRVSRLELELA